MTNHYFKMETLTVNQKVRVMTSDSPKGGGGREDSDQQESSQESSMLYKWHESDS